MGWNKSMGRVAAWTLQLCRRQKPHWVKKYKEPKMVIWIPENEVSVGLKGIRSLWIGKKGKTEMFWKTRPLVVFKMAAAEGARLFMWTSPIPKWCFRDDTSADASATSGHFVDASAHAFLDGHPADGRSGCQVWLGRELLHQDLQDCIHFPVHLVNLNFKTQTKKTKQNNS